MAHRLRVHLGRNGPKSVELEESVIEVSDDFAVELENHGPPQHVHVAPEEDLSRFARVTEPNHFIDADDAHIVSVEVAEDRPAKFDGRLKIVTGYGTEETHVGINLRQQASPTGVAIDESLGKPQVEPATSPSLAERLTTPRTESLIALAAIAIFVAVGAMLVVTELAVVLGALAVLVGVGIAVMLLVR